MSLPETDTLLFFFINRELQNSFFDIVMPFITLNAPLIFSPIVLWLFIKEKKKIFLPLLLSLFAIALADGGSFILKDILIRPRPCSSLDNVNMLIGCGNSFSMPSNHASNAFAFAMTIWFLRKDSLGYMAIIIAAIIGFSRVYVGVHYLSDVVVGGIAGITAAYSSVLFLRWAEKIREIKAYDQGVYFFLVLISLFRIYYILTGPYDLSPDEAHYWEWSRRLDWSYYSKGPMIAWLIYTGTSFFGDNVLGVRFFSVILSAVSSILLYLLGKELYDERTGFASSMLIQIVPLFSVFGIIFTIDAPFIFFWILSLYIFHKVIEHYINAESDNSYIFLWILLGISTGAGLLSKYTMVFFLFSGFLFMLFQKKVRGLLKTSGPYVALLTSLIVFSPVMAWNAAHGWITVKHTAAQAHINDGLLFSFSSFLEFAGSQAGVLTPILFVLICVALWRLRRSDKGALLFWFAAPVISFFFIKSMQGKVQANWALSGYITGIVAFAAYFAMDIENLKRPLKMVVILAVALSLSATILVHLSMLLNLPPDKDPTKKLFGWKEIGSESSRIRKEISSDKPVFIFSDSYQVASELAFYMEGKPTTYCINLGRRMNQYDLWPGFENLAGQNAVFVSSIKSMPEEVESAFDRCDSELLAVTTRQKKVMQFTIGKCYDFKGINNRPVEKF